MTVPHPSPDPAPLVPRTEAEKRALRCCFAGHRLEKLSVPEEEVRALLRREILAAVSDGFVTFLTGMGMGVDLLAGETVCELRDTAPSLHLIAVSPYPSFAARWSDEWKQRYFALLKKADLVRFMGDRFDLSLVDMRNRWMVDHSGRLIVMYSGEEGRTRQMIAYAGERGVPVRCRIL